MLLKLCTPLLLISFALLQVQPLSQVLYAPVHIASVRVPYPLTSENSIVIQGVVQPNAKSLVVNLQQGGAAGSPNIGLQLVFNFADGNIVFNARRNGVWLASCQKIFVMGIGNCAPNSRFEIIIHLHDNYYVVSINSQLANFSMDVPLNILDHVYIEGQADPLTHLAIIDAILFKTLSPVQLLPLPPLPVVLPHPFPVVVPPPMTLW